MVTSNNYLVTIIYMDDTRVKRCWRCPPDVALKTIENFCRNGKDSVCKKCRYELNAEWASDNREKLRSSRAEYMRQYRAKKKLAKGTSS